MKKQDVLEVLNGCNGVVTRCELLGTERSEVIREFQKENPTSDYIHLHSLYKAVEKAQNELEKALNAYLFSVGNIRSLNFEALRNGVRAFAEERKTRNFVAWFDDRENKESVIDIFFSVSVLASKIVALYTDYVNELDEVNEVRRARESAKDRKARLLAELARIEAAEAAEAAKQK